MRKLNVHLLAGLIIGSIVLAVGIHFLHEFQVSRNASSLLEQAQTEQEEGNYPEAMKLYSRFINYRRGDEAEKQGWEGLAEVALAATQQPNPNIKTLRQAYAFLDAAAAKVPENQKIRRELIDFQIKIRQWRQALEHLEQLIPELEGEEKAEMETMLARCRIGLAENQRAAEILSQIVGYNQLDRSFSSENAPGRNVVKAYIYLEYVLRARLKDEAGAKAVLEEMVKANPNSFDAQFAYGRRLQSDDQLDQAETHLLRARDLAEEVGEVVDSRLALAEVFAGNQRIEQAKLQLDDALQRVSSNDEGNDRYKERVYEGYMMLAIAEGGEKPLEKAQEAIQNGLQAVPDSTLLLGLLTDLQLQAYNVQGAEETLDRIRENEEFDKDRLAYLEARLKFAKRHWHDAARDLEDIRPALADSEAGASLVKQVDVLLGQAYEQLRRYDQAVAAWGRVLKADPDHRGAKVAQARINMARRHTGSQEELQRLEEDLAGKNEVLHDYVQKNRLQVLLNDLMLKPEAERDWTEIDGLVEQILPRLDEARQMVLQAEIFSLKGETRQAGRLLGQAQKKFPNEFAVWKGSAEYALKVAGAARALKVVDDAEKLLGDSVSMRDLRAKMLALQGGPNVKQDLKRLEQNLGQFSEAQRKELLTRLGGVYLVHLKDLDEAERLWNQVAEEFPKDATIRMTLYDLALQRGTDEALNEAIENLGEVTGKDSPEWQFAEAARLIFIYRRALQNGQPGDEASLERARALISQARGNRPNWDRLVRLTAEVDGLQANVGDAIANLKRVLTLRPDDSRSAQQLLGLLASRNQFEEARRVIRDYLSGNVKHTTAVYKLIAEVEQRTGHPQEAAKAAASAVPESVTDPREHIWKGDLLRRAGFADQAETAFRQGVAVAPQRREPWLALIEHLILNKQEAKVTATISEMQSRVAQDERAFAMAQSHEMLQQKEQAEKYYVQAAQQSPNDTAVLRGTAAFFVRDSRFQDARPYLDRLLAKEGSGELSAEDVSWARRVKSQQLANLRSYPEFLEAKRLIDSAISQSSNPSYQDLLTKAMILADRSEPGAKREAIDILERLRELRPMPAGVSFLLATLYSDAGDTYKARDEMLKVLAKTGDEAKYIVAYVEMLLKQGDGLQAAQWAQRLEKGHPKTVELYARIMAKQGKVADAVKLMKQSFLTDALVEKSPQIMLMVASRLEEFGALQDANEVLQQYTRKDPSGGLSAYLRFLGRQKKLDEALRIISSNVPEQARPQVGATLGFDVLNMNQGEASSQHFQQVGQWIDQAIAANPDVSQLQLRKAELLDLQGNDREASQIFEQLLQRGDLSANERVIILNNLAFNYAVRGEQGDKALRMAEEAIGIRGPAAEILDTRAMAHLATGNTAAAIKDLNEAIFGGDEPIKLFHLAWAHEQANNTDQASEMLRKAHEQGLDIKQLSEPEQQRYQAMVQKLGLNDLLSMNL